MNTQQDEEFGRKIAGVLDRSNAELRQGTAYRLQLARQAALARMAGGRDSPLAAPAGTLAGAGGTGNLGHVGSNRRLLTDYRVWLGVLALAGAAYFYDYWSVLQQASELAELDAALLSSDVPFDAFLDKGFENWLKRSGQ